MLLGAVDDTGYRIVVLLHITCVVIGIGGVFLNGVYGMQARKVGGSDSLAIIRAVDRTSNVALKFIYLIPIFGLAAIGASDKLFKVSQTWVWLSLLLYIAAVGIAHAVLKPTAKKMIAVGESLQANPPTGADGPPPQVAQMQALGKKMGMFSGINQLLTVVIIGLMIWKPGF